MNYIQRAWLYVLKPVNYLINEKLANKSGILGRIGRFWSLGPREFGYHPTSKFLAYFNANFVHSMIWTMMHYPILK